MRRALALALKGRGTVEPNPMVGCVIVKGARIIGEGYHERFGGPHAEPNALAACSESPEGGTAYVTLEPCCHTNKKTPPCVPKLIEAKLSCVVIACVDPNSQVSGRGIESLRSAGIAVATGILEPQAKQLNAAYFKRILQHQPYVTLKWAQSANGKVGGPVGKQAWISNDASTRLVHELRSKCDAILIGINTALSDDPLLTARGVEHPRPLIRAVADSNLRLPLNSRLVRTAAEHPVLVYCGAENTQSVAGTELRRHHVRVQGVEVRNGQLDLKQMLVDLYEQGVTHLLVEPGPTLAKSFLDQNLADRVWIFCSPKVIEGHDAPSAPIVDYPASGQLILDDDQLTEYLNRASPAFVCLQASPDLPKAEHFKLTPEVPPHPPIDVPSNSEAPAPQAAPPSPLRAASMGTAHPA